jgi:hypothetical protein
MAGGAASRTSMFAEATMPPIPVTAGVVTATSLVP